MVVAVSPCFTAFRLTFFFPSWVLGPVLLAAFLLLASILRCDVIGVLSVWRNGVGRFSGGLQAVSELLEGGQAFLPARGGLHRQAGMPAPRPLFAMRTKTARG